MVVVIKRKTPSIFKFISVAILLSSASIASADWSGGIEGGTVLSGDDNATRLRLKLANNQKPLSHYIYADWVRSDGGDDSYELGYKPRYWFGDQLYVFGEAKARQAKAAQIDQELFGLTGVGMQFIDTEESTLWAEVGAGYRTIEFSDDSEVDDTTAVARAAFRQILGDLVQIELDADSDISEAFTTSTAEAGIAVRVSGGALKYSYRTRRFKAENESAVSDSDSFVSFSYGF